MTAGMGSSCELSPIPEALSRSRAMRTVMNESMLESMVIARVNGRVSIATASYLSFCRWRWYTSRQCPQARSSEYIR